MSKVNVISTLENISKKETLKKQLYGILKDENIIYKEESILCEFSFKNFVYKRKLNESESFSFYFKEAESSYIRYENKRIHQVLDIPLYTKKIEKNKGKIDILYQVDNHEEFHFRLEYRM